MLWRPYDSLVKTARSRVRLHSFYAQKPGLLPHLRPNYIHSASNDIHTDGPRATARASARARARARARFSENLLIQHIS